MINQIVKNTLKGKYRHSKYRIKHYLDEVDLKKIPLLKLYDEINHLSKYTMNNKKQNREIFYTKYLFYSLAFDMGYKHLEISKIANVDRSTVYHGLRQYEIHKNKKYFSYWEELKIRVLNKVYK